MIVPPRLEIANGIHHVVARGNERTAIFWDCLHRQPTLATAPRTLAICNERDLTVA